VVIVTTAAAVKGRDSLPRTFNRSSVSRDRIAHGGTRAASAAPDTARMAPPPNAQRKSLCDRGEPSSEFLRNLGADRL
jgi:hypothetical protein